MRSKRTFLYVSVLLAGFLTCLLPKRAAADEITYSVTVNTSSEAGYTAYLDMQFTAGSLIGGGANYYSTATATVSNLQTNGALTPEDPYSTPNYYGGDDAYGDVSGTLPGNVLFTVNPSSFFGEYSQPITFGSTLSFDLTLAGPSLNSPTCPASPLSGETCNLSQFVLDFYDTNSNYLFTDYATNPNDWLLGSVMINADTTTSVTETPGPGGPPALVSFQEVTPAATPEPSSFALVGTGLLTGSALLRRRFMSRA